MSQYIYSSSFGQGILDMKPLQKQHPLTNIKDPGSALTHFIGFMCAVFLTPVLLIHASKNNASFESLIAFSVFMLSSTLLYAASTAYHTFMLKTDAGNRRLRKLDHCMIPVLIAGSYTPICVVALGEGIGTMLLRGIWILAFLAVIFKLFWIGCPKWVSSAMYLILGWFCVLALPGIFRSLRLPAFFLLLSGGLIYSAGAIIYALNVPLFNSRHPHFGSHEIFHLFVMGGNLCHFIVVYVFLAGAMN